MPTKRLLIDAAHPEETRVAVVIGNRLEEFDVEVASRRQLKGNIYLAKVTRVEPSLQAAFVDYGGNRHGFLAFNEIHPDYYQIPVADREALVAEQAAAERDDDDKADGGAPTTTQGVETVGGDDTAEEAETRRPRPSPRSYRIQEVIKARQILLVQVVKEERGNKGAALTTYLSLAGRYCVLMPNTARGGGISRRIANNDDRKRLKTVLSGLEIPPGMGVIVRTAGHERSKTEIKRDYDYLLRQWDTVRELTLKSIAPTLVHEEANLIKRTIRDLYSRDIEEVIVDGEEACRNAKTIMRLLTPSHAKRVQLWSNDGVPLFRHYRIEDQIEATHAPEVKLHSGGYIHVSPTEALIAIDVNSGRATRERNIEETALRTNLEASDEIARQLRLRDLAGLIVIDFIDMERSRNRVQVERALKEAMRRDRARIQFGRISPFGLLELSRQRLRPSLLETSFETCTYCAGTGVRPSVELTALNVLRGIEEEGVAKQAKAIAIHVTPQAAFYILNHKRASVEALSTRYGMATQFIVDGSLEPPHYSIERTVAVPGNGAGERGAEDEATGDEDTKRRRRRKPRRRSRGDAETTAADAETAPEAVGEASTDGNDAPVSEAATPPAADEAEIIGEDGAVSEGRTKRRRRGRRGGGQSRKEAKATAETTAKDLAADEIAAPAQPENADRPEASEKPKTPRRRSRPTGRRSKARERTPERPAPMSAPDDSPPSREEDGRSGEPGFPPAPTPEPERAPTNEERPLAIEQPLSGAPDFETADPPGPSYSEPDALKRADIAKTTTVAVGTADREETESRTRKGWWRRLTE
ncbi:MAG: Rne/Rng family ribonuclease [Rhodospirillales bacterium]|jgi:ribonuclease E|nr:Rne/Rng family ribonuclease [Rhodospirillales bacterium]